MEDVSIIELYWARSQDAIVQTKAKYGRLIYSMIAYGAATGEFLDAILVGFTEHLAVFPSVERQYGTCYSGQVFGGVETQEGPHPSCIQLLLEGVGDAFLEVDAVNLFFCESGGVFCDNGLIVFNC